MGKYISLSRDAAAFNKIINHPDVISKVSLGFEGYLDATNLVLDPRNLLFLNEVGAFLLVNKGPRVYEIHTQFLPDGRGIRTMLAAKEAMEYMFTETDCETLITDCPLDNPKSKRLAVLAGLKKIGEHMLFNTRSEIYSITKEAWLCQSQQQS